MLADARRERILGHLAKTGGVGVADLAAELSCAEETVRRDLSTLEARGRLRRVHGGAVRITAPELPPIPRRVGRDREAKETIADAAVELVPVGAMVFIGAGSTTLTLAARLIDLPGRTCFVSNMPDVAQLLVRGGHEVHLAGGELHAETHAAFGSETLRALEGRMFDLAVVGAAAMDAEHGLLGTTPQHAALQDVLRRRSRKRIVLADASKFGRSARYLLWGWRDIDVLVTDRDPPAPVAASARHAGTRLVVAEPHRRGAARPG